MTETKESVPVAANNLLATQTEKPHHYTYLKEFRCDQCKLFLQHKCTQHKPFTCFNWHFMNQRRRRPVRKRDGCFNYSPDIYCTKYDETSGICQEGDDCQYLHRTAGDTERRYHLRYYKTGICVYDTDSRGYCVKNGPHCAFAHGVHDLRNPVYDIKEIQAMELGTSIGFSNDAVSGSFSGDNSSNLNSLMGPNSLDKERNALNDDPRWQDTTYVLANYKTEICKRPPRLCRQGYACPQYHNNKDRRRSPKKYKYRSTPCPNVKQGDEWGDPTNCDAGDSCPYCHTRTEQQFHPEIYKSTKCNDMQQTNYCPRGPFCAFAHVEKEISAVRDLNMDTSTDLASILSSALPSQNTSSNNGEPTENNVPKSQVDSNSTLHTSVASTTSTTTTSNVGDGDFSQPNAMSIAISRPNNNSSKIQATSSIASSLPDHFKTGFDPPHFGSGPSLQSQLFLHEQTPTISSTLGTGNTGKENSQINATNSCVSANSTISGQSSSSNPGPIARPRSYSSSNTNAASMPTSTNSFSESLLSSFFKNVEETQKQDILMDSSHPGRKLSTPSTSLFTSGNGSGLFGSLTNRESGSLFGAPGYPTTADTVESCLGLAVEDLSLDDIHLEASLERELGPTTQSVINNSLSDPVDSNSVSTNCVLGRSPGQRAPLLGSTAPVNIPGARLEGHRPIANLSSPPMNASPLTSLGAHSAGAHFSVSPYTRNTSINAGHGVPSSNTSSIYDFASVPKLSPSSVNAQSTGNASNAVVQAAASMLEMQRLRDELSLTKAKLKSWEESLYQARTACEVWKREAEEAKRREKLAEQQRDEALITINNLRKERSGSSILRYLTSSAELENLTVGQLQQLQQQLRSDLECVDKEVTGRT